MSGEHRRPRDEVTWEMIQTAFAETEKIMKERGWSAESITDEYVRRVVERIWDDEEREALCAKVQAKLAKEVDALFFNIGAYEY